MAKWDLSKLPEGRKPLPDEWFAERAQMQGRIKELEGKLEYAVGELQAMLTVPNSGAAQGILKAFISALIYSLTGGKDE